MNLDASHVMLKRRSDIEVLPNDDEAVALLLFKEPISNCTEIAVREHAIERMIERYPDKIRSSERALALIKTLLDESREVKKTATGDTHFEADGMCFVLGPGHHDYRYGVITVYLL